MMSQIHLEIEYRECHIYCKVENVKFLDWFNLVKLLTGLSILYWCTVKQMPYSNRPTDPQLSILSHIRPGVSQVVDLLKRTDWVADGRNRWLHVEDQGGSWECLMFGPSPQSGRRNFWILMKKPHQTVISDTGITDTCCVNFHRGRSMLASINQNGWTLMWTFHHMLWERWGRDTMLPMHEQQFSVANSIKLNDAVGFIT